ncbi:MAG: 3-oxoacyl-[acyl-carrier-protein] synthase III C-terminal domain-containing protein [Polyangiaceae bacterium]
MGARILSTGAYLPERRLSRAELEAGGLQAPRGLNERRAASAQESSVFMAEQALQQAMNRGELDPREIDFVIAFSGMGDWDFPKDVNLLPGKLGLEHAACWSIDTACASFISAMKCAHALIASNLQRRIAIVTSMNWSSRGIAEGTNNTSLGDGAAAVIVESGFSDGSLIGVREKTDSSAFDFVMLPSAHARGELTHFEFSSDPRYRDYFMQEALSVPRELFGETSIQPEDVDWFIPHQANLGMVERWADALDIPAKKLLTTFDSAGNLSAVNIPLTLDRFIQSGHIERGHKLLFFAPGAGMHLAAMLWRF